MYEFICAYCGKAKQVPRKHDMGTCCSRECATKLRAGKQTKRTLRGVEFECIFKPDAIICTERKCETCGWNPVVANARLEAHIARKTEPKTEVNAAFGEWVSVEEGLPREGEQVLAYTHTGKVMSLHCRGGRFRCTSNVQISHWMPMPTGPKV